jgi:hypothetical protein
MVSFTGGWALMPIPIAQAMVNTSEYFKSFFIVIVFLFYAYSVNGFSASPADIESGFVSVLFAVWPTTRQSC